MFFTIFKKSLILVLFFGFITAINAQSDYEKTQNFKNKYASLEQKIKDAITLEEVDALVESIAAFKNEFADHKALLDKTLYPDNFSSAIEKLEKAAELRKGDFTQIVDLQTEVGTLKTALTELNDQNASLLVQIKDLQFSQKKDQATINSLNRLVASLKANIKERDELVKGIVDSLLQEFTSAPSSLNDAEKTAIFKKVETGNLFYNVERTISDNIQFMKVTSLTADDLSDMKEQYKEFSKTWRQIGPKLSQIYLNQANRARQIAGIDELFRQWNFRINNEIWSSINQAFREKNITLMNFKNGDDFTESITTFIDDEVKNLGVKRSSESKETFYTFTDSVWFQQVKPNWVPILIENNLLTEAQKDTIETRFAQWKEKVDPGGFAGYWIYIAIAAAAIVLVLIAFMFISRNKKNRTVAEIAPKEND
ncbi:hypothetical protein APF79_08500 [bacterium BRH_c32]|nr:MAG: hypothetical protein APF79_08500 [bacterium BRH_c32]